MRFRSDENVQYRGFRAIYNFLPDISRTRPYKGACFFEVSGLDGTFGSKDIAEDLVNYTISYNVPLDCTWVITVDYPQKNPVEFPAVRAGGTQRVRHQLHRDLRREDGPAAPAAPVLRLRHRSGRVQDQRPPPALLRRVQLAQVVLQRHLHVGDAVPRGRRRRRLQMPRLRVRLRG